DRNRNRRVKRTNKLLNAAGAWSVGATGDEAAELLTMRDAMMWTVSPDRVEFGDPSALGSVYVPPEGVSVFRAGVKTLAKKYNMQLPIYGQELVNLYHVWPTLNLKKSGEKQKLLKL